MKTIRDDAMSFACCFPMTEILRTVYAQCMESNKQPLALHEQYIGMRKMLI